MTEAPEPATRSPEGKQLAEELVERASEEGVDVVSSDRLLAGLAKDVPEAGLGAETTEHLGYGKDDPARHNTGNSRNEPGRRRG